MQMNCCELQLLIWENGVLVHVEDELIHVAEVPATPVSLTNRSIHADDDDLDDVAQLGARLAASVSFIGSDAGTV